MEKTYNFEIKGELFDYSVSLVFEGSAIVYRDGDIDTDNITATMELGIIDSYGIFVPVLEDVNPDSIPKAWPEEIQNEIQRKYERYFDSYVDFAQVSAEEHFADSYDYDEER